MEVDRGLVMRPVPVATCHELDHLDLAVDPLGRHIGDPVPEVGQEIGKCLYAARLAPPTCPPEPC